jgi:hypothetical protein
MKLPELIQLFVDNYKLASIYFKENHEEGVVNILLGRAVNTSCCTVG